MNDEGSFYAALVECVKAAGGSKAVAALLWPAKCQTPAGLERARRDLCDCLDPERPAKLSLDELVLILREARARGCHVGMEWLCEELSYAPPQAVKPRDEADQLRRRFVEQTAALTRLVERIEQLEAPSKRR